MNRNNLVSANVRIQQQRSARRRIRYSPSPYLERIRQNNDQQRQRQQFGQRRQRQNSQEQYGQGRQQRDTQEPEMEDSPSIIRVPSPPINNTEYSPASPVYETQLEAYSPAVGDEEGDELVQYSPIPGRYSPVTRPSTPLPRSTRIVSDNQNITVTCNICYVSVTEPKNTISSFVTLKKCNHRVCFKCFTKILDNPVNEDDLFEDDNLVISCPFCRTRTEEFCVYTENATHTLTYSHKEIDTTALSNHWQYLLENNTINNSSIKEQKTLEQELRQLKTKNIELEHSLILAQTDVVLANQQRDVYQLQHQHAQSNLEESNKEIDELKKTISDLHNQLQNQVKESQDKFKTFQSENEKLLKQLQIALNNKL
jgi:Zinc finger, C3HC4 type (RING finger)